MSEIDWESGVITLPEGINTGAEPDWESGEIKPPVQPKGMLGAIRDTAVSAASGAVTGVQLLANAAGADNAVSQKLGEAADYVRGFESEERSEERAARAAKIKTAEESGSTWEEIKANVGAFGEAPIDTTVEALGTSLPTIAATVLTRGKLRTPVAGAVGAAQGAGSVKGAIYDAVEQQHLEAGATPEEAQARAAEAQAYAGDNAGQIALGAGLGAVAGSTGVEGVVGRMLGREAGEQAAKGVVRSTLTGAAKEAPLEAMQGGQERLASNLALQNEGFDTPTWQGVAGQAALEGVAGAAAGGGFGAVEGMRTSSPQPAPEAEPVIEEPVAAQTDEALPVVEPVAEPAPPAAGPLSAGMAPPQVPQQYRTERPYPAKPSERMGLNPADGALSAAAALAVDSGAAGQAALQRAAEQAQQGAKAGEKIDTNTGEITQATGAVEADAQVSGFRQGLDYQQYQALMSERGAGQAADISPSEQGEGRQYIFADTLNEAAQDDNADQLDRMQALVDYGTLAPDAANAIVERAIRASKIARDKGIVADYLQEAVARATGAPYEYASTIDRFDGEGVGDLDVKAARAELDRRDAAEQARLNAAPPASVKEGIAQAQAKRAIADQATVSPEPVTAPAPADASIQAITAKQIPDMSDAEIEQAIAHYGPDHKRTAKLQKEQAKRATQGSENVPQAAQAVEASPQPAQVAGQAPAADAEAAGTAAAGSAAGVDHGARWEAMSRDERQALAAKAGVKPVFVKSLPGAPWDRIGEATRQKLIGAMSDDALSAEQGTAQVADPNIERMRENKRLLARPSRELVAQAEAMGIHDAEQHRNVESLEARMKARQEHESRDIGDGWYAFHPDSGTVGIPRADMPQIKAEHRGAMVNFLNARGVQHQESTVPASALRPTQAEFSRDKVAKARDFEGGNRSILISQDGHVLDGHHQWLAAREKGEDVKAIRLDAPIRELVKLAHEFPSSTTDAASESATSPSETVENKQADEYAARLRKLGDEFQGSYSGRSLAPLARAMADHAIEQGRRLSDAETEALAQRFNVPVDVVEQLSGNIFTFDALLGDAQRREPGAVALRKRQQEQKASPGQPTSLKEGIEAVRESKAEVPAKGPLEIPEATFTDLLQAFAQDDEGIPTFTEPSVTVRSEDRAKSAGELLSLEQAGERIAEWEAHAKAQGKTGVNSGKVVLSLFDTSGEWSQPWVDAGYEVHRFDIQDGMDVNDFSVEYLTERLGIEHADVILAAPPCTDFSSSGAHAWKKKDADGRTQASIDLVQQTLRTVELFKPSAWAMENPVGRIAKLNGLPKPTLNFQPNSYGDPYTKRTLLWGDFNPELPTANVEASEGSKMTDKLSGKDKYQRSLTPKGFAYSFFMANNLADMSAEQRLAAEFKGIATGDFKAALDAGMTEDAARTAVQDAYYDQDLEGARQALQDAKPTPPPRKSVAPEQKPASTSVAVRIIRAKKALLTALEPLGFADKNQTGTSTHTIEGFGRRATVSARVIADGDTIQYKVTSTAEQFDAAAGRLKAFGAGGLEEVLNTEAEAVELAKNWQTSNRAFVKNSDRPKHGEPGYTIELAREDLAIMQAQPGASGYVRDSRQMDKIRQQEKLIEEMEAEQKAKENPLSTENLELASRHKKIDKTLDLMDDAQIEAVYARAGLAGKNLDIDQKRQALKQEHPDDIEPLLKPQVEAKPAESDLDAMFDDVLAEVTGEPAAAQSAPVVEAEPADEAAVESLEDELRAQKKRVMRLKGGDATKLKAAETRLRRMRTGIFEAEDKLVPAARAGDAKALQALEEMGFADTADAIRAFLPAITAPRSLGDALGSAGKNVASALDEAINGLGALFGGAGKLGSGLTFDEETYAKAKPLFISAVANLRAASADLRDAMRAVVSMVVDRFGAEAAQNMKPYVVRFIGDVRDGKVDLENNSEQPANGDQDQGRAQEVRSGRSDAQPGAAQADTGDVAAKQPADGRAPDQAGDSGRPGIRGAGANVANGRGVPSGRDAGNGRQGASGAGAPSTGAGTAGSVDALDLQEPVTSPAASGVAAQDLHISDPLQIVGGTPVQRFNRNREALELLQTLDEEGRQATPDEQKVLAGYIGWGSFGQELFQGSWERPQYRDEGVWKERGEWLRATLGESAWKSAQRSITNAHYTDPPTVMAMWDMVRRMGFTGGKVLEPSMGTGNFYSMMPADLKARSQLTGIELDETTGAIAKQLFPKSNVRVMGYQDSKTPDNFYDLVIGNWPFENTPVADRRYNKLNPMLHDYFFLKTMDQVRPGGIVIGITSAGSMDKQNTGIRRELAKQAELVSSIRLPSGAFSEYAGTKVVTDIVILRKRPERLAAVPADATWVETGEFKAPGGQSLRVNQYYLDNPQNIIGQLDYGNGTTTFRAGMIVHRPDNMAERLAQAVELVPQGAMQQRVDDHLTYYANETGERHGAVADVNGELMIALGDQMVKAEDKAKYAVKDAKKTADREQQIRSAIGLRKLHTALVDAERAGRDAEGARKALRDGYQAFVKAHGSLRDSFGLQYLGRVEDPFYAELAALENDDGKPAAVMQRSTTRSRRTIDKPTVRDAYVLARNESINPSIERVAELAGKPAEAVRAELVASGAVFEAPNGDMVPSDIYLSGNVRVKLREAQAALADGNGAMAENIAALEKVMPADVPYFNIETKLGATWVPADAYRGYIAHMLSRDNPEGISVEFRSGRWKVRVDSKLSNLAEASTNYGTSDYSFPRLVQAAMSNQTLRLTSKDADGKDVYDAKRSEEVNAKVQKIREDFGTWLWSDPERRVDLEREYNEARNAWATPTYDGSFMSFEGMALTLGNGVFNLRQHQVNAIWRAIVNRRSINAHEVGTGKTFTMGGIAVESRRYGLAKKPVILAHNANSATVAAEIRMMYPAARVLYIDNLDKKNRAVRLRQIANDDWDAIVLPHSLIDKMALTEETLMQMAQDDISALEAEFFDAAKEDGANVDAFNFDFDDDEAIARVRSVTAKELAKARKRIIENIKKQAQQSSREDSVSFEDLGIDMILVDEAHEFKKPPIVTRMQMKGLNTQVSNRSIALQFLTRYVRQMNNGGNVHTFTGTPITNTITEIYHQMRYVMESEMEAASVSDWDGWFGSFATEVQDVELTAAGEYEMVTRLAGFVNVPELRRMVGQYMDTVFADDMPEMKPRTTASGKTMADSLTEAERADLLNGRTEGAMDRPYKKVVNESADMTEEQLRTFNWLQQLARDWRSATGKQRRDWMRAGDERSPIVTEGLANKASFDVRLLGESLAGQEGKTQDDPNSKASRAVRNVLEIYKSHPQANQVIFAEMGFGKSTQRSTTGADGEKTRYTVKVFSPIADIVERLVQGGIPREQIAIVDGSTSKERRKEIAQAMNNSTIRVVLGSTDTLGVGVNMQRNLRAMHHLDAPYMPGELEQRNGRGQRQGNQWNTVLEYRYMTDRLDGRRWQILAVKQRFITAFMKAGDNTRTIEGEAAADEQSDILESFSEAAGDPRVLQRVKVQKKLEGLRRKERLYSQGIADMRSQIRRSEREADEFGGMVRQAKTAAVQALIDKQRAGFTATIDGKSYTERKDAVAALEDYMAENARVGDKETKIGTYGGHPLSYEWLGFADAPSTYLRVDGELVSGKGIAGIEAKLRNYPAKVAELQSAQQAALTTVQNLREAMKQPFSQAGDLERAAKQLDDLEKDLALNPVPPPAWLRQGAPIDSEVYRKGKPYVVTGHRYAKDGWFVVAEDGKGATLIPYLEATDSVGMPLYEEREFVAPAVEEKKAAEQAAPAGDAPLFNRQSPEEAAGLSQSSVVTGKAPANPLTLAEAIAAADKFLADYNGHIELSYRIRKTQDELYGPGSIAKIGVVKGAYHPGRGLFTLTADHLSSVADTVETLRHELLGHYGLDTFAPADKQALLDKILASKDDPSLKVVWGEISRLYSDKSDSVQAEEVFARLAEGERSGKEKLADLLYSLLTRLLRKVFGYKKGIITRRELLREIEVISKGIRNGSRPRQTFESETNQRRGTQTDTEAFRRWFGNSKVTGKDGAPLVLHHGTAADFTVFDQSRAGSATGHATSALGIFMSSDRRAAQNYAEKASDGMPGYGRVMDLYASIQNPYLMSVEESQEVESPLEARRLRTRLEQQGYDGIRLKGTPVWIAFNNYQVKSATDNNGDFDEFDPDIRFSRSAVRDFTSRATQEFNRTFSAPGGLSWWHKTVGTMYNLAQRSPHFKPVFEAAQGFIDDVSHYASDAAELAPKLLPKLETWRDLAKSPVQAKDNKAISAPIFEGTLMWARDEDGKPVRVDSLAERAMGLTAEQKADILVKQGKLSASMLAAWRGQGAEQFAKMVDSRYETQSLKPGIVWTDAELRSMWHLTDGQIELYREFRDATNRSLDTMARADMLRFGGEDVKGLRERVMDAADVKEAGLILRDHLAQLADAQPERAMSLLDTAQGINERVERITQLQAEGYAPLSRFGKYTVDVVGADGERQYFSLFETKREANLMAEQMKAAFPGSTISQGTLSEEAFKLFAGITPETLELFGNAMGLDSSGDSERDKVFQDYLKLTKTNRSAMKRLIHRQGIAGYSEDVGRVLASFVYSNARQTAAGLNMGDLSEAVNAIPQGQGELKDAAVRLADYIKNPQEEAQALRGLLFAQYLGGSVASAFVNMTQPVAVTFPWLSQYGGAKRAAGELSKAAKQMATKGYQYEADLAKALHLAEEDGTVSPQEVHQLMAQASGTGGLRAGDGTRAGDARALASNSLARLSLAWGKMFGAAEEVNRRMTFIAAYRIAKAQGNADPAAFARLAVRETQFIYSKASKMRWGRGAVGSTLMTFKTYSVAYLELMGRLWNQGEAGSQERKDGRKAALLMIATLMLLGGAGGLPFAEDAEDLIDGMAQLAGYNFSTQKAKEQFLIDVFGDDIARFIDKGVTGLPGAPLDVSGRLGMGNLIPGTGLLQQRDDHSRDVLEIAGPAGDLFKRMISGAHKAASGDLASGLLEVSPVAVRNFAKGADMAVTDMYRDDKGYKVLDTNSLEAALKAVGFQPQSVAAIQEANWLGQRSKALYSMRAQEIRALWAQGVFEKDPAKVQEARAAVADWNAKNPDQPMRISVPDVMRRVREMGKSKDQRIADTAPRAMRQQLREDFARVRSTLED
ncbi:PLxRFG domain-containing protein [Pseudomonas sp. zbq_18]|uniref:PLxRFG domain-containing protein n=1 Tax=Pseudomonas sp. zbq_18 TaxID=3367251 RepID=UPI00370B0B41